MTYGLTHLEYQKIPVRQTFWPMSTQLLTDNLEGPGFTYIVGHDSGGVAFYIRDDEAINSEVTSNGVNEALGIHLKSRNLIAITIYRQPDDHRRNHRSTCAEFKQLTQALSNYLMELPSPILDLIICGDLNLPRADWENGKCQPGATKDEQQMVLELHTLTAENFMVQYIYEPTYRDGNTLDLLFSNNSWPGTQLHISPFAAVGSSHDRIQSCLQTKYKSPRRKRSWKRKWSPEIKSTIISQFQLLQWRNQLGIHQPRI